MIKSQYTNITLTGGAGGPMGRVAYGRRRGLGGARRRPLGSTYTTSNGNQLAVQRHTITDLRAPHDGRFSELLVKTATNGRTNGRTAERIGRSVQANYTALITTVLTNEC